MSQVITILLCLFMEYWQSDGNHSLSAQIPDIINHLCPGSNVCSNNRSFKTPDDISFKPGTESCCAECSCSATCANNTNCCYPKKIFEVNEFRNDRSCLYPIIPQPSVDHHLYHSFLMVSSVPRPGSDDVSNVSCGDMNVAPWGSFYPVYSAKSKQVYKNIECAKESGQTSDVILWDAVINCNQLERDQGINTIVTGLGTNSIPEKCHINFVFPGDFNVLQPLKCFINLIDTCTESRDFDVPEGINVSKDDIKTLCSQSGFVSPYRARKMYANVFCHICSAESFHRQNMCYKYSGGSNPKGGDTGGFMALIDGKFITENRDTGNTRNKAPPFACSILNKDRCRQIFCPVGQLRDRTRKCVYPNKIWYNQDYVVYVNLTLYKSINVSEVFNITYGIQYSTILSILKTVWLRKWDIASIYFREMDVPNMSNNLVISIQRKLSTVKPDILITNIAKMIGQAWSIRLRNVTEILISSNFSIRSNLWWDDNENKRNNIYNITENVEIPIYKRAYHVLRFYQTPYLITKLYICDQVELEPSEFWLSNEMVIIYRYATKRFMFDSEFTLVQSPIDGKYRARICLDDSGLYKRATFKNFGTIRAANAYCDVVASMLIILLQRIYQL